jgi:hypothetical protein
MNSVWFWWVATKSSNCCFVSFGGDHWALHRLLIGHLEQVTLALLAASSEDRALHQCMPFDQLREGSHCKIKVKQRQGGLS